MRRYREKCEGGSGAVLQGGVAAAGRLLIVLGIAGPVLAHTRTHGDCAITKLPDISAEQTKAG